MHQQQLLFLHYQRQRHMLSFHSFLNSILVKLVNIYSRSTFAETESPMNRTSFCSGRGILVSHCFGICGSGMDGFGIGTEVGTEIDGFGIGTEVGAV